MFRRLRLQFIALASLSIMIIFATTVGVINSVRYYQTEQEITRILNTITDNNGYFANNSDLSKAVGETASSDTLRYYSVVVDRNDDVISSNTEYISAITDNEALEYALAIRDTQDNIGTFRRNQAIYSYQISHVSKNNRLIVVLDTSSYYTSLNELAAASIFLGVLGVLIFIIIVSLVSGIVIRPFIRNYEKQRRFITNAGHELKTPLAIISANTELQEMMTGETEWTKSTNDQVERLTNLINSLVALSRLEEQPDMVLQELDFSAITEDAAEDFKGPVVRDGKTFNMEITPGIRVKAEEKSLFELVTLLVDNANKYCDPEGTVNIRLYQTGRTRKRARLEISNTYKEGKNSDYSKFFERFYREDESHNNQKKGYGIGLSMAQNMVKAFKGRIFASYKDDTITFTVVLNSR